MKPKTGAKRKGWPLIVRIGIGILILIVLAGVIMDLYLNQFIASHLKSKISKSTKGLYALNFKKVEVNVFTRKISIQDAELHVDSAVLKKMLIAKLGPSYLLEGQFPTIELDQIHWMHLLFSNNLIAGALVLHSPDIQLTQTDLSKDSTQNVDGLNIHSIHIDNAKLKYLHIQNEGNPATVYNFEKIALDVNDLLIGTETDTTQNKPSFNKIELAISGYEYRTADSMYIMGFHDLHYSSEKNEATIAQTYIRPRLAENGYHKLAYQQERNDIKFENLRIQNVSLASLRDSGEIDIRNVFIGSGHWNIYLSRVPPLPKARKNVVPSQPLLNLVQTISIDTLHVNKFQLDYREYNTATQETGEIKFNDINGKVTNITNDKRAIGKNAHMVANLDARLMGTGKFDARFDFLLSDPSGKFSVEARLGKMEGELLNPGFVALNKMEIKKGTIDELHCTGTGNESAIHGDVSLLYHDLHIAVMKRDNDADTMKRRSVVSIVANAFVINDNPKKDEPIRVANNISLTRDRRKSYFNMLWMALFEGIIKIAAK